MGDPLASTANTWQAGDGGRLRYRSCWWAAAGPEHSRPPAACTTPLNLLVWAFSSSRADALLSRQARTQYTAKPATVNWLFPLKGRFLRVLV